MRVSTWIIWALAVPCVAACNAPKPEPRPSGLRNMAPPPIQEAVQDDLDVEPNDTFIQATDVTMTSDAMQWSGTLAAGDVDVWRVKARAGSVVDIEVLPADGESADIVADFSVSDREADRRFYDSEAAGHAERIPNIALTPQGGYLTVRARGASRGPVRYRVAVARIEPPDAATAIEAEPNDVRESAVAVMPQGTVEATLFPSGDVDYFRTTVDAPTVFSFRLPALATEAVIERGGQVIWSHVAQGTGAQGAPADGAPGADGGEVRSDIVMPDPQPVYIRVKGLEAVREVARYAVTATRLDKIPDEIEPNNTPDRAQVIQGDTQALEFSLADAADIDIFRVVLRFENVYRVRLTGPQAGQAHLQAIDSRGALRTDVLSEDQVVCDARLQPNEDALWLKVYAGTATWPLPYRIAIDAEDAAHVETEPNATSLQANPLELGTAVSAHIFPAGDVDMYRVALPSYPGVDGPIGTLRVDVAAGYVASLQLKLLDGEGYEISQARNEQYSRPIRLSFDAPNGTYFISVTGAGDACLKPYRLTASFEPNEAAIASLAAPAPAPDHDIPIDDLIQAAGSDVAPAPTPSHDEDEDAF